LKSPIRTLLGQSLTNAFDLWPVELKEVKLSGKIGGKPGPAVSRRTREMFEMIALLLR
jgi:hypothetical protein